MCRFISPTDLLKYGSKFMNWVLLNKIQKAYCGIEFQALKFMFCGGNFGSPGWILIYANSPSLKPW